MSTDMSDSALRDARVADRPADEQFLATPGAAAASPVDFAATRPAVAGSAQAQAQAPADARETAQDPVAAPAPRARTPLIVMTLRTLLSLEVVALAAAAAGANLGAAWTGDAVGAALLLPMLAIAVSSAADLGERRHRHAR